MKGALPRQRCLKVGPFASFVYTIQREHIKEHIKNIEWDIVGKSDNV